MITQHRNGLKGHQHTAQGIALGRMTIVKFALKGQKIYPVHYSFALTGRLSAICLNTQGVALGYVLNALSGRLGYSRNLNS